MIRPRLVTKVSVPGKLILMGEHAVVYGRPALVAAIDLRLVVRVTPFPQAEAGALRLVLPDLGLIRDLTRDEVVACARAARERWEAFVAAPDPVNFARLRGTDPAHVVLVALGEGLLHCGGAEPLDVEIRSALPAGSGFGSSSAAAVGILAALLIHHGLAPEPGVLDRLAMEVERRQHGLPSGVDHRTVIAGGVVWAERSRDGCLDVAPVALDPERLAAFQVFATGTPQESTGEVVAAVRRRIAADPVRFEAVLDEIGAATLELRGALGGDGGGPEAIIAALRRCTRGLEALGVVPAAVQERIRRIEAEGGGAKISGAGALSGTGAGCLLVYPPSGGSALSGVAGLVAHRVRLGEGGLCVEVRG